MENIENEIYSEILEAYSAQDTQEKKNNFVYFQIIKLMRLAKGEFTFGLNLAINNALILLNSLFLQDTQNLFSCPDQKINSFQLKQIFLPEISAII